MTGPLIVFGVSRPRASGDSPVTQTFTFIMLESSPRERG